MKLSSMPLALTATVLSLALTVTASSALAQRPAASSAPSHASPAPATAPIDLEPGVRFGALRLGMTNAQVTAAMPGIPLRPDTREIDRADHSISAFIGPFEIVFAASGELRSITAALPELQGGVRIGGHILGANSTPAAVISVLHGCRAAAPVGGGHITQCTGIDVMDLYTAERLRLTVHH